MASVSAKEVAKLARQVHARGIAIAHVWCASFARRSVGEASPPSPSPPSRLSPSPSLRASGLRARYAVDRRRPMLLRGRDAHSYFYACAICERAHCYLSAYVYY